MNKMFGRILRPGLVLTLSAVLLASAACSEADAQTTSVASAASSAGQSSSNLPNAAVPGSPDAQNGTEQPASPGGQRQGGGVTGTVSEISGSTLTLTYDDGTITVILSDDTDIQKTVTGASDDLAAGLFIQITGTADSSGNIAASQIAVSDQQLSGQMSSGVAAPEDMQAGGEPPDMTGDNGGSLPAGGPEGNMSGSTPPEMSDDDSTGSGTPPEGGDGSSERQGRNPGTMGTIVSVGDGTMTVTTLRGEEITVTFDSSTVIIMTVTGTISDITEGQTLQVKGVTDEDGNITADSITIES